jgi:hypothetical protein
MTTEEMIAEITGLKTRMITMNSNSIEFNEALTAVLALQDSLIKALLSDNKRSRRFYFALINTTVGTKTGKAA